MHTTTGTVSTVGELRNSGLAAVLTVGFGTTVAMWALGYVGRLPGLLLPSPLLLALMLACLVAGGLVLGRRASAGWWGGALAGIVAGLLNLLVLGSLLTGDQPNRIVPSALWWVPGSMLVSVLLVGAGSWVGSRAAAASRAETDWPNRFVWVAVAATSLLLAVGGVVTSAEAGLAVDDWPTSFGYNMFLYPFSRMTGGIYYEHAHRLIGALVGLTTVVLALGLQWTERRRWVRAVGWLAVALVVLQGTLGGLRVTERSLGLAMTHGVLGQLFFGTVVALAAFTAPRWRSAVPGLPRPHAATDRVVAAVLVALLVGQLLLGASQRHLEALLLAHIAIGVAVVAPLAIHVGMRAWGLNEGQPLLQRLGLGLVAAVVLQILLGFGAYVATGMTQPGGSDGSLGLVAATVHQWFGAVLLATAVLVLCWNFRLLRVASPDRGGSPAGVGPR